jgi:hypothetical protein
LQPVPIRINPKETGRVNRYNLSKLSGAGHSIASSLEYAIECLLQGDTKKRVADLNLSIEITVYPRNALRHQEDARLIRMDVLASLEANKRTESRLVTDDPNIFQLAPDGRPVVLKAMPLSAGEPNVSIATYFPRGERGPFVELVTIPMSYVVDQKTALQHQFVVYCHTIVPNVSADEAPPAGMSYVGITKQGWRKRFDQHLSNARCGSPLLFHRALRDHYVLSRACSHRILTVVDDEKSAMDCEEEYVRGTDDQEILGRFWGIETFAAGTLYPKGLNMIPGGYEGLRVLHKLGAFERNKAIDIEKRDERLITVMQRGEREGRSNPLLATLWLDDDYAMKIICGPDGRLKPNQIAQARLLSALGRALPDITTAVGAKSESQILRLLRGKTYTRIKT